MGARLLRGIALAALLAVVAGGVLGCNRDDLADRAAIVPCYMDNGGARFVADSGCTIQVNSGGALTLGDGSTVTGVVTNDLDGASLILDPGGTSKIQATADYRPIVTLGGTPTAAALVVNDSAGTPAAVIHGHGELSALSALRVSLGSSLAGVTGTVVAPRAVVQPIAMATAGTVPLTIPAAGQVVCIYNTGGQAVTIADTGNQVLSAAAALGQYDVVCGFSDGTRFIEFARSNN